MNTTWNKNISPVGWYVAIELLRFIPEGVDPSESNRRFLVWENLILIQADDPESAYNKAIENGEIYNDAEFLHVYKGKSGRWRFEGLMSLLPVYDELEDGAELLWSEYYKSSKGIERIVKTKEELEVFQEEKAR